MASHALLRSADHSRSSSISTPQTTTAPRDTALGVPFGAV